MILFAVLNENGVAVNKEKPKVVSMVRSVNENGEPSLIYSLANGTREEVTNIIGEYRDTTCQVYKTNTESFVFVSQDNRYIECSG